MVLFWITLVLPFIGTNASGEFYVLYSPSSLSFIRTSDTYESLLKEIFCAALGLSVEQNAEWKGMYVVDPFNTPEAAVEVYIDGVSSLGEYAGLMSKVFPLIVDEYEPDTFKGVKHRIKQRFDFGENKIVNIKLSDENMVQTGVLAHDNLIDFYHFRFRTLHALSDFYGPISRQTKEAKKLLGEALQELSKAFVKAYDGSVLVTVVTTDVAHARRSARSLTKSPGHSKKWPYQWLEPPLSRQKMSPKPTQARREEGGTSTESSSNEYLPPSQSADNAAIFNILLWFGMVISFSMIAIIYACMEMDPGRDTIIYRMTTMRTKKTV